MIDSINHHIKWFKLSHSMFEMKQEQWKHLLTSSIQLATIFLINGFKSVCKHLKYEDDIVYLIWLDKRLFKTLSSSINTGSLYATGCALNSMHIRSIAVQWCAVMMCCARLVCVLHTDTYLGILTFLRFPNQTNW